MGRSFKQACIDGLASAVAEFLIKPKPKNPYDEPYKPISSLSNEELAARYRRRREPK